MSLKNITRYVCYSIGLSCLSIALARDPFQQPFHHNSIWNTPIGSEADYVHARIQPATAYGMTIDEDLIVLIPTAPAVEIYISNAGWDRDKDRCQIDGGLLFTAPIPDDFVVSPDTWDGLTPNSGLAVLLDDWRTLKQTQPFARCVAAENGTSRYLFGDVDLYGDGAYGAHGATGLSAIGGALRVGELVPGAGPIRHALKVNIYAAKNVYYDAQTRGYRWPAKSADSYAPGTYGTQGDPVPECRMGALLALPAAMHLDDLQLQTEPARMLAQAFQDYGAYLVDDTAWDVYAIITEWGPAGRVKDEFERAWGFSMSTSSQTSAWAQDMRKIFTNLHVVVNNASGTIGGGGVPRAALAEPIEPNVPPTVRLKVSTTSGEPPLTVEFDAAGSIDPDGDPITCRWDFGDGEKATGATVSHTYDRTGIYRVTLHPDDGYPLSKYVMQHVTVQVGVIQQLPGVGMGSLGSRANRGNTFDKALDGDLETFFEGADADSSWVGLDFERSCSVIAIAYAPRSGRESRMIGGWIQGANRADFRDGDTLFVIQDEPEAGRLNQIILNNYTPYRYVCYIGPARSYSVIAELAFYGSAVTRADDKATTTAEFCLQQNYPNPFNASTCIAFSLEMPQLARLDLFDLRGRLVATLLNQLQTAGEHRVRFDAASRPAGHYFYRLQTENGSLVRRMTLLK